MQSNVVAIKQQRQAVRTSYGIIDFMTFVTILLIGADIFGINIGVNIRIVQILAVLAVFLMLVKDKFALPSKNIVVALLIVLFLFSCLVSQYKRITLPYFMWLVYNYIFIFGLAYSYILYFGFRRFYSIFRLTMYVQVILVAIQFFAELIGYPIPFFSTGTFHGIPRPAIWFYEPSYFATYLSFWLTVSLVMYICFNDKKQLMSVLFSLLGMILCTATTGFVAIGIAVFIVVVYSIRRNKWNTILKLFIMILVLGLLAYVLFKDIVNTFVLRLITQGIKGSDGGRTSMYKEIWNVFKDNWLFGVGPGAYGYYMGEDRSYVPSNVTLELLSTCGILVTVLFYTFVFKTIYSAYRVGKRNKNNYLVACSFGMLVFIIVLQANQNYLRLYMWMFLGILAGYTRIEKKKRIRKEAVK